MALDINTAGQEFVKTAIALYRSGKYYREKEILAKKFLEHCIEAGNMISEVGKCPQEKRRVAAKAALRQLDRAMFVLSVMGAEGIYSKRRMNHVTSFYDQLKDLLTPRDDSPEVARPYEPRQKPPQQPQLQPERKARLSLPQSHDDGGFNEVYEGKLKY